MKTGIISPDQKKAMRKIMLRASSTFFATLLLINLAACGGGGGGGNSTPVAATAPQPVSVYMEGDSTMWGGGFAADGTTHIQIHPNAVDIAQSILGSTATLLNEGHSAQGIMQFLEGTGTYTVPWAQYVKTIPAKVVVENFGINDAGNIPAWQFQQALLEFIAQTRAAGKIPVLEEPNPICTQYAPQLAELVSVIDNVALQENVPLIPQYQAILAMPNWQADMEECVHPVSLYPMKGTSEAATLKPLIASLGN